MHTLSHPLAAQFERTTRRCLLDLENDTPNLARLSQMILPVQKFIYPDIAALWHASNCACLARSPNLACHSFHTSADYTEREQLRTTALVD